MERFDPLAVAAIQGNLSVLIDDLDPLREDAPSDSLERIKLWGAYDLMSRATVELQEALDAHAGLVRVDVQPEREETTMENTAENIVRTIEEIRGLAEGRAGDDPIVALEDIRMRAQDVLITVRANPTLRDRLAEAIAIRNVGGPSDPSPYPASVDDVADEIATFVGELEDSGAARELRALLIARLSQICDERREHLRKIEEGRQRLAIESVMATVAAEHLYPALRAAGITDPETRWELRGRWESGDE